MSTAVQTPPKSRAGIPQRSYTVEEIERGLTELAICGGNHRLAHERLKRRIGDKAPPADTMRGWTLNGRRERYLEIVAEVKPKIIEAMATEAEQIALEAANLQRKLAEDFDKKRDQLSAKELSTAARDWSTVFGISVDKSSVLRGRPTEIVEHRAAEELIRALETLVPTSFIDGTATEIPDVGRDEQDPKLLATNTDTPEQRA